MKHIRNSAKALIIRDGKVLASKMDWDGDIFYILPGGGQDVGELLTEAVKRECAEELGVEVEPKSLVFVIEGERGEAFHKIDVVFLCEYVKEIEGAEIKPDENQVGIEWLGISNLMDAPLYPKKLRSAIMGFHNNEPVEVYLGNENVGD